MLTDEVFHKPLIEQINRDGEALNDTDKFNVAVQLLSTLDDPKLSPCEQLLIEFKIWALYEHAPLRYHPFLIHFYENWKNPSLPPARKLLLSCVLAGRVPEILSKTPNMLTNETSDSYIKSVVKQVNEEELQNWLAIAELAPNPKERSRVDVWQLGLQRKLRKDEQQNLLELVSMNPIRPTTKELDAFIFCNPDFCTTFLIATLDKEEELQLKEDLLFECSQLPISVYNLQTILLVLLRRPQTATMMVRKLPWLYHVLNALNNQLQHVTDETNLNRCTQLVPLFLTNLMNCKQLSNLLTHDFFLEVQDICIATMPCSAELYKRLMSNQETTNPST
ncbi:hypothetical protein SJAG_00343 [Schizosaccharomyces japonicus yFS275]|uniref:CCR4-NOT transcription complex subunit 11 n=1 Tax=Schizosaccharomyces japonicus (strain yFS275 / FY16936) TaxID=402676 RepID=B6JVD6_SCHJY|nr:hypothetical protein SJAG_00343 [Schizosaccharomyces japonicus yFS275]EEB05337.1 hypothetical protein SJAG_00343 [Schizosaccharomyces japonicus yFS275]